MKAASGQRIPDFPSLPSTLRSYVILAVIPAEYHVAFAMRSGIDMARVHHPGDVTQPPFLHV